MGASLPEHCSPKPGGSDSRGDTPYVWHLSAGPLKGNQLLMYLRIRSRRMEHERFLGIYHFMQYLLQENSSGLATARA